MYKQTFSKFWDEKRTFQSSGTKNELHAKFKDENNSLIFLFLFIFIFILFLSLETHIDVLILARYIVNFENILCRINILQERQHSFEYIQIKLFFISKSRNTY